MKYEFIIYAIIFMVCFNFWNYNNIFGIVNKIDHKVIWSMGITLFVFSFLPYLTTFVAENFNLFFSQFMYGLSFIVTALLSTLIAKYLKQSDPANIALQLALGKDDTYLTTIIIVLIGMVIGYLAYPPAIIISCLLSLVIMWILLKIRKKI